MTKERIDHAPLTCIVEYLNDNFEIRLKGEKTYNIPTRKFSRVVLSTVKNGVFEFELYYVLVHHFGSKSEYKFGFIYADGSALLEDIEKYITLNNSYEFLLVKKEKPAVNIVQQMIDKGVYKECDPDHHEILAVCDEASRNRIFVWIASGPKDVGGRYFQTVTIDRNSFLRGEHISSFLAPVKRAIIKDVQVVLYQNKKGGVTPIINKIDGKIVSSLDQTRIIDKANVTLKGEYTPVKP